MSPPIQSQEEPVVAANVLFGSGSPSRPDHSINQQDDGVNEDGDDQQNDDGDVFDYFSKSQSKTQPQQDKQQVLNHSEHQN